MSQIKFKNLPKGFEYPFTKNEIREFIKTAEIDLENVTFWFTGYCGGMMYSSNTHFVVNIDALSDESSWYFTIKISAMKTEGYEDRQEEIAQLLLSHVKNWIRVKLAFEANAPKKPSRAVISFNLTEQNIVTLEEQILKHRKSVRGSFFSTI
jgi:hypothetical protein